MRNHLFISIMAATVINIAGAAAEEPLLYEDFSKCTAGSVDLADETNIGTMPSDNTYSRGEIDNYTSVAGWSADGLYQAGGTVVLRGIDNWGEWYQMITTPAMQASDGVKASIRMRIYPGDGEQSEDADISLKYYDNGYARVDAGKYKVSKEWQVLETSVMLTKDSKWRLTLDVANEVPVQIDWVKIEAAEIEISAPEPPVAKEATNVTATSFRANWEKIDGVYDYKIYVTYQQDGKTLFFWDGEPLTLSDYGSASKKVDGLDPATIYSYYVTALRKDKESEPSNVIDVVDLPIPTGARVSEVKADGFKLDWEQTGKAQKYVVRLYTLNDGAIEEAQSVEVQGLTHTFTGLSADTYYAAEIIGCATYKGSDYESYPTARLGVVPEGLGLPEKVLFAEDFAKFTHGDLNNIYIKEYDHNDPNAWGGHVNDYRSHVIPDEMTNDPGWKGSCVAEGGGMAAIANNFNGGMYSGAYIETPEIEPNSLVTVSFRIHGVPDTFICPELPISFGLSAPTGEYSVADLTFFPLQSKELNFDVNYLEDIALGIKFRDETYRYSISDEEWHEYEASFIASCDKPFRLRIGRTNYTNDPFFIDDIVVKTSELHVDAPVAWDADDFTADGFTAYWGEVKDADDYLLSVYCRKAGKTEYAVTDLVCTGTKYTVTGLDVANDWFYTVKARRGGIVSAESNAKPAIWVNAPQVLAPSECDGDAFTANWTAAAKATRYVIVLYRGAEGEELTELERHEIENGATTQYRFQNLDLTAGSNLAYALKSYYDTSTDTYESPLGEPQHFDLKALGVERVARDANVVKANGEIVITGAEGVQVEIYNVAGVRVFSCSEAVAEVRFRPAQAGAYLIKINSTVTRLMF